MSMAIAASQDSDVHADHVCAGAVLGSGLSGVPYHMPDVLDRPSPVIFHTQCPTASRFPAIHGVPFDVLV